MFFKITLGVLRWLASVLCATHDGVEAFAEKWLETMNTHYRAERHSDAIGAGIILASIVVVALVVARVAL